MTMAYERYLQERRAEEEAFRANRSNYQRSGAGRCSETAPLIGHCDRKGPHYTHEARAASGHVLGRWRIRKVIEQVDPNIQLPE